MAEGEFKEKYKRYSNELTEESVKKFNYYLMKIPEWLDDLEYVCKPDNKKYKNIADYN